jgi:hypothetical protein
MITILMSLAAIYLVAWEYDRLKPVLLFNREDKPRRFRFQFIILPVIFAAGGALMGVLWWLIGLGNFSNYLAIAGGLALIGLIFGFVVALHYRFMPVGHLAEPGRSF